MKFSEILPDPEPTGIYRLVAGLDNEIYPFEYADRCELIKKNHPL
jgi:hypothetical protein